MNGKKNDEENVKIYVVIMSKKDFKFKYLDKVPNQFRHANESFTITEISSSVSNFQKKKRNDMVALNTFK